MTTIPHTQSGPTRDRFHLDPGSDLTPLADAARAHTRAGLDRIEHLASVVMLTAARAHGLFDVTSTPTGALSAPLLIDTIAASLARSQDHRFTDSTDHPDSIDRPDSVSADEMALFPDFAPAQTFHQWTHNNLITTDFPVLGTLLGTSRLGTETTAGHAMTLVHGLPRFLARAKTGAYTMEHIDTAARLCRTVAFEHLPTLDAYLTTKRADVTVDTFRTSLRKQIALLEDTTDQQETIRSQRRVERATSRGVGYLTLIGPALETEAAYRRIEAMARAIRLGNTDSFGLAPGDVIDDDRSIAALMFDMFTRPVPELALTVTTTNPTTGIDEHDTFPWTDDSTDPATPGGFSDETGHIIPLTDEPFTSGTNPCRTGTHSTTAADQHPAFLSDHTPEPVRMSKTITVRMPTTEWWLSNQAKLITTVPFITAFAHGNLPGSLPDGSPIPPGDARRLVGCASTLTRVLTDPATGTPLDAKALTYRIPMSIRTTLIAKYQTCSMPGCTRRADTAEIDHIEEFFHLNPAKGGATTFANLHVLCSSCHGLKTARKFDVAMTDTGELEYSFPHGLTTRTAAPDDPINSAQARILHAQCEPKSPAPWLPPGHTNNSEDNTSTYNGPIAEIPAGTGDSHGPAIRISPGLQEKWARALRWLYEHTTRIQLLSTALRHHLLQEQAAWVRLRNSMDWQHAVFPKALPPAPIRLCLPPGDPQLARQRLAQDRALEREAHRIEADMRFWGKDVPRRRRPGHELENVHWNSPWDYSRDYDSHSRWDHDPDTDPPPF